MTHALSIVVPYRDRPDHLARFLAHMAAYFSRDKLDRHIPYRITVVEQAGDDPFNGGMLKNAGFLLTRDRAEYACFHDVDYLPIWADYSYPSRPARLVWYGADRVPVAPGSVRLIRHDHRTYFGGVVMFTRTQFEQVNGYSNQFWGWGFEDVDLRNRCLAAGLDIELRDGTYQPLHHANAGLDASLSFTEDARRNRALCRAKHERLLRDGVDRADGLTSCRFEVVGRIDLGPAAERVTVHLPPPAPPDPSGQRLSPPT